MQALPLLPTQEILTALELPEPGEVSILQLLLGLVPSERDSTETEASIMARTSEWDLILISASGITSAMASTLLHSYNLSGHDIAAGLAEHPQLTPSMQILWSEGEFSRKPAKPGQRTCPDFFQRLKALIERTVGASVPDTTWDVRTWANFKAGPVNIVCALAYKYTFGSTTPNQGNPMASDGHLVMRPQEWGISAGPIEVDVRLEWCAEGGPNGPGFYTHLGTNEFSDKINRRSPATAIMLHPFVVLQAAVRMATTIFVNMPAFPVHEVTGNISMGHGQLVNGIRVAQAEINFMGNTGFITPLTIRTFDHREQLVTAPCITHPPVVAACRWVWTSMTGKQPIFVPLQGAPATAEIVTTHQHLKIPKYKQHNTAAPNAGNGRRSRSRTPQNQKKKTKPNTPRNNSKPRSKSRGSNKSGNSGKSAQRSRSRSKSQASRKSNQSGNSARSRSRSKSQQRSQSNQRRSQSKSPNSQRKGSKSPANRGRASTPAPKPKKKGVSFHGKKGKSPGRKSQSPKRNS
jgi:hypothetical protein